jgi:hypothetical protein
MIFKYISILFIGLFTLTNAWAQDISSLEKKGYDIEHINEDISKDKFIKDLHAQSQFSYLSLKEFKRLFLKWNPHIKNLSNLKGQNVYVSSPYAPYITYKHAPDLKLNTNVSPALYKMYMGEKADKNLSSKNTRSLIGFAHITTSQGIFNEKINSSSVDNNQNSPITFGAGAVYIPQSNSGLSYSGSFYISKLTSSSVDDTTGVISSGAVEIPNEIGANFYLQKSVSKFLSSIYGGVDYEKFSTLNFEDIINNNVTTLANNQEQMIFATIGTGIKTKILLPTAFKISYSHVLSSKTDLSGFKYLLYANQKLTDRFWYHLLYKQHILESSTSDRTVTISRYGVGVGMAF